MEIYIGQNKFVAVLNCAPNLTTFGEIWSLLHIFLTWQRFEVGGQTHAPAPLLPETVGQAIPAKDVLRTAVPFLTI